ncbi:hypothetical protein KKA14_10490 [bacterium]|nr:hypothetical protein [bacterium]
MAKTRVNYSCGIKVVTADDKILEDQYTGSFTLEEGYETDFGGEDVFIMPEIMREVMYHLDETKNEQAGLLHSKSLDLSITDYNLEYIDE